MAYTKESLLVPKGKGEQIHSMLVKVRASELGNDFSIMEGQVAPKQLLTPHVHTHEDQAVFVISGELEFEVGGEGGERFSAKAGDYVIKPRRVTHGFWNASDETTRYIELSGRRGFEEFVDTTRGGPVKAALAAEEDFGVEFIYSDIPRLMKEHGLTSIVGVEGIDTNKLPKLPGLPELPKLFG